MHFEPVSPPENLAPHLAQHQQVQAYGAAGRLAWQRVIEALGSHGITWQAADSRTALEPQGREAAALPPEPPAAAPEPSLLPQTPIHMIDPRENPGLSSSAYLGILVAIFILVAGLWLFLGRSGSSSSLPPQAPAAASPPAASPAAALSQAEKDATEIIMNSLDWRCSGTQLDSAAIASLYSDPVTYDGELIPRSELMARIGDLAASARREFKLAGPLTFRDGPLPGLIVAEADVSILISNGEDAKPELLRYTYTIKHAGDASLITDVKTAEIKP